MQKVLNPNIFVTDPVLPIYEDVELDHLLFTQLEAEHCDNALSFSPIVCNMA